MSPDPHAVVLADHDRRAYVPDLGNDCVYEYAVNVNSKTEILTRTQITAVAPGAGPRHMVLSPDESFYYLLNQTSSTIIVFHKIPDTGNLAAIQELATLPDGYSGGNSAADVRLAAGGRLLIASNRGHDSLVAFRRDPVTGELSDPNWTSSGGECPRNFSVVDDASLLVVANRVGCNLVSYWINSKIGLLHSTGHSLPVSSPVFVTVLEDVTR